MGNIISASPLSRQALDISLLLNNNNQLTKPHNPYTVMQSKTNYLALYSAPPDNTVIACIGMEQVDQDKTILKHLCVYTPYRRKGFGKLLVNRAIELSPTEIVLANIRHDNKSSLALFQSLGFMCTGWTCTKDHYVLTVQKKIKREENEPSTYETA